MPSLSKTIRQQVARRADHCCEYCKTQQILIGMPLVIDHILPTSAGGSNELENLAAACYRCNQFKGAQIYTVDPLCEDRIYLFNPRSQVWLEHFYWAEQGLYILGKTPVGSATVKTLRLNNEYVTESRKRWISQNWHPPNI